MDKDHLALTREAYNSVFEDYANIRRKYNEVGGRIPVYAAAEALERSFIRKPKLRIIDIGCGMGHDMMTFPKALSGIGYKGKVGTVGCDLSERMVEYCQTIGLKVFQGDLLAVKDQLGTAHLVWAHMSLIHIPPEILKEYYRVLFDLTVTGGIVGVGFKTGNDDVRIDPADDRVQVDRNTFFPRRETVETLLTEVGFSKWLAFTELKPAESAQYTYAHILMQK